MTGDSGEDLRINQLLYTPIAIARVQKVLVEALISHRLNLQKDEWNVLIEECDVPFAKLAVEDFKENVQPSCNFVSRLRQYAYSTHKSACHI